MGVEALDVLANRGYFKGEEVLACEPLALHPTSPSRSPQNPRLRAGSANRTSSTSLKRTPIAVRPTALTWRFTSAEKGMTLHSYWTSKCAECPLKTQCTTGKERRIKRWEHEVVIDAMQDRLDRAPKSMRVRRATVEHRSAPSGLDGRHPRQNQNPRKGPNRDKPPRSGLQSEACDRHRGCPAPDEGHVAPEAAPQKLMLLSKSVEIRQSETASRPTIRRSRICVFFLVHALGPRASNVSAWLGKK